MALVKNFGLLVAAALVVACAPKAAPILQGEPIFDMYGGQAGCESGVYVPGAAPQDQCLPSSPEA